jgi:hypothetical protein
MHALAWMSVSVHSRNGLDNIDEAFSVPFMLSTINKLGDKVHFGHPANLKKSHLNLNQSST